MHRTSYDRRDSMAIRLCVCESSKRDECPINEPVEKLAYNMFSNLANLDDLLKECGKLKLSIARKKRDKCNNKFWQWNKVACTLYYIILYNEKGIRLPEHDTICPSDRTEHHDLPDISGLTVRVLSLMKTNCEYGFVDICVTTMGLKNYHLVADLSTIKNENRPTGSKRVTPIHLGFLCSDYEKCIDVERVAFKILTNEDQSKREDRIKLALQAGGQYNVTYLACTETIDESKCYIAMELCIQTFDALIDLKPSNWKYIDEERIKICFRHILLGLNHLHSKNIQHNKIEMENILLSLDGKYLKIGEYDYVERIEQGLSRGAAVYKDVKMTAIMFLKCFHRKSTFDAEKEIEKLIRLDENTSQISKEWISLLTNMAHKITDSKLTNIKDSILAESFDGLPSARGETEETEITTGQKESNFSAFATHNLTNMAETLEGTVTKLSRIVHHFERNGNSYLEAYLIMHMILDKPASNEILQHPYFWTEHKLLHFISRMEGYFYHSETVWRPGNIDLSDGTKQKPQVGNVTDRIETIFREACKSRWSELDWIQELKNLPKSFCRESTRKKIERDFGENKDGLCNFSDIEFFITTVAQEDIKSDEKEMAKLHRIAREFWENTIAKQKPIDDETCNRSDIKNSDFVSENWKEMDAKKKEESVNNIWKKMINKKTKSKHLNAESKLQDIKPFLDFLDNKLLDREKDWTVHRDPQKI